MNAFLLSLLASAIVAIMYGAFIAQREDRIRRYLSAKQTSWTRRRYVKAVVSAVRGDAATLETTMLSLLILLAFGAISLGLWEVAADFESRIDVNDIQVRELEQNILGQETTSEETLTKRLAQLRIEIDEVRDSSRPIIFAMRACVIGCYGAIVWAANFWVPFVVARKSFAYQIDRFILRIQGLASKSELAELAMAESQVDDERSLRAFLELAARVAARHGIHEFAARFDLWEEQAAK